MRKFVLIFFVSVLYFPKTNSQSYHFFPDSNAVWCADLGFKVVNQPLDTDEYHTYRYQQYLLGDTLINGIIYNKIYENGIFSWVAIPPYYFGSLPYYYKYAGCYRELNKKIFYISPPDTVEYLLYDFTLNIGDTLPGTFVNPSSTLAITGIDSIYDGTAYRKRYKISTADTNLWQWPGNFEYASLIQGIGSTHGLLWWLTPYFEMHGSLFSFKQNGIVIYPDSVSTCEITAINENLISKNQTLIYPNPSNGIFTIHFDHSLSGKAVQIFDVTGKIIYEKDKIKNAEEEIDLISFPKGIYFLKIFDKDKTTVNKIVIQ